MRRDWIKIGEIVEKIKELGLSCKEGAKRFDISESKQNPGAVVDPSVLPARFAA